MKKLSLTFFSGSFQRFGSEIALFNLIQNADSERFQMTAVARYGGDLLEEMSTGVLRFQCQKDWNIFLRYWHRAQDAWVKYQSEAPSPPAWLRSVQSRSKSVAWYINSIVQPDLLRYSRAMGIPAILHVHELELGLQWVNGKEDVSELVSIPDLVITCSEAAKKMMKTLGREGSIEVIYPAIKTERWVEAGRVSSRLKRSELGISKEAFVWACSGHVCPRKNPILFIHLLAGLKAKGLPVHFLWIGNSEGPYAWYAKCLARELGLEASITWAGQQTDDYRDWMQIADGYVLTSTQESFSIATMEAACLGKPIVATPCGGVAEILKPGMGVLLKNWSVEGGVEALVSVMTRSIDFDPEISRERVREFDLAVQGPKWEKLLLERYLR